MTNYENEKAEVIEWLKHPNELAKAPAKIEFVKEFTDEEGIHCLIFRFKKGIFSPWMMAIHSDSGIFSEQEKYDEANDIAQATKMVNYLKQYWKNVALNEEEKQEREEKASPFCAFLLKAQPKFEPALFLEMFENDWGEKIEDSKEDAQADEAQGTTDARVYSTAQGFRLILGYMDFPVPNNEAEENAKYNFLWKDAVAATASHMAHEIVFVAGGESARERALFYSKVLVTLCKMENHIGVYANGVVYDPMMIINMETMIKEGELPIPALVWCGVCQGEDGLSAWTEGMGHFGFDEMELLSSKQQLSEIVGFMLILVEYCINNNIAFHDKETVALSASTQLRIEKSKGCNVNESGETLKICLL